MTNPFDRVRPAAWSPVPHLVVVEPNDETHSLTPSRYSRADPEELGEHGRCHCPPASPRLASPRLRSATSR